MEISTLQIVLVFIVAYIAGIESILDEFQFHRPLVARTLIGLVLGDIKSGIIIGGTLEMIALGWMNIGAAEYQNRYCPRYSSVRSRLGLHHHRPYPYRGLPTCG